MKPTEGEERGEGKEGVAMASPYVGETRAATIKLKNKKQEYILF